MVGGLPRTFQSPVTAILSKGHMTGKETKRKEGTGPPGNTFHAYLQYAHVLKERLKGEGSPTN